MFIPFSPLVDNENTYKQTFNNKKYINSIPKQFFSLQTKQTSAYFLKLKKNNHMIPLHTMPKSIQYNLQSKSDFSIYKKNIESLKNRMQIAFDQYKSAKTF